MNVITIVRCYITTAFQKSLIDSGHVLTADMFD